MKKIITISILLFASTAMAYFPHGWAINPACPKDKPFQYFTGFDPNWKGNCLSCDDDQFFYASEKQCKETCPNRIWEGRKSPSLHASYCRKICPPDKPFFDLYEEQCKSCTEYPAYIKKDECLQCPNMRWVTLDENYPVCLPKDALIANTYGFIQNHSIVENIIIGPRRLNTPPVTLPCHNDFVYVYTSPEECAQCSNTYMQDGKCYFKKD